MKTAILAGGFGTRMSEETTVRPKPMVEIGGKPILWHIMSIYAASGFNEFVVALGYKGEVIKDYFKDFYQLNNNLTIHLGSGSIDAHEGPHIDWTVHLIDTGTNTMTGGRIKRLQKTLGNEPFFATYGDGLSDIDLKQLLAFHKSHGRIATVTAVRPPSRFGEIEFDGDFVKRFSEKPQIGEGWISGGFFVFNPEIFDYIEGDDTYLERDPMVSLSERGELVAFRHQGFWQPMDTLRDKNYLDSLWQNGKAPWKAHS